jgi:hypothetical protein
VGHGFTTYGTMIRHDSTAWVKSQADSDTDSDVDGVVVNIIDANNFEYQIPWVTLDALSGLVTGETYFLDPTTAGAYTLTPPTALGTVSKPVLRALSTTEAIFTGLRGAVIGGDAPTIVNQVGHGFTTFGTMIRFNGSAWVKSQANSDTNADVDGIVINIIDANNFEYQVPWVTLDGFTGLTPGTSYFLDPTTAGAYTSTQPNTIGQVTKPVLRALSTTEAIFIGLRGAVIAPATYTTLTVTGTVGGTGSTDFTQSGFTTNAYYLVDYASFDASGATGGSLTGVALRLCADGTFTPRTAIYGGTSITLPTSAWTSATDVFVGPAVSAGSGVVYGPALMQADSSGNIYFTAVCQGRTGGSVSFTLRYRQVNP